MRQLEIKSLQDDIVAQLSRAILDGDIESGSELTQVGLAEELGVSRMPVREALFALEHQGLVTRLPNNHCRVSRPTRRQLARILELCRVVEADVVRCLPTACELPASEMAFHAELREACGEGYPRRVLTTTAYVYIAYLVDIAPEGAAAREAALARVASLVASGGAAEAVEALASYFDLLMSVCPFPEE